MRTLRMEASRGYNRCRHASMHRSHSMLVYGYRNRRHRRILSFIENTLSVLKICMFMIPVALMVVLFVSAYSKETPAMEPHLSNPVVHTVANAIKIATIYQDQSITDVQTTTSIPVAIDNIHDIATSSMESHDTIDNPPVVELDEATILANSIGSKTIELDKATLNMYDLPDMYYPDMDYSSFQPYMDYRCITNKNSPAYKVSHSELAYTDEYGMRRYKTTEEQFTVNGQDDYTIALGTFYKEKGTAGSRYLIVTTTGMYTAITGDEKSDAHTDSRHMFSLHQDGSSGGIIEWIVDQKNLERTMRRAGTITAGPIEALQGEIVAIYGIQ